MQYGKSNYIDNMDDVEDMLILIWKLWYKTLITISGKQRKLYENMI